MILETGLVASRIQVFMIMLFSLTNTTPYNAICDIFKLFLEQNMIKTGFPLVILRATLVLRILQQVAVHFLQLS